MILVWVMIVVISLIAALAFDRVLLAATRIVAAYGVGYLIWGIVATYQVTDENVNPNDIVLMVLGIVLIVIAIIMYGISWFRDVRARYPRR